jgi:hypothetical protein
MTHEQVRLQNFTPKKYVPYRLGNLSDGSPPFEKGLGGFFIRNVLQIRENDMPERPIKFIIKL